LSKDLQLKKGGRLFIKEWDKDYNDFIEKEMINEELMFHFYDSICLERGITLKDLFLLVKKHVDALSLIVGCPFLDDLVEEALSSPVKSRDKIGMVVLKLSWFSFIEQDKIYECLRFYGMGNDSYSLEFTPINELVFYPLILDEEYIIVGEKEEEKFKSSKDFKLIDLLRGVIDELSYMGPPDIREFARSEISKKSDEPEVLLSIEELENKFNNNLKKTKKPCYVCGDDSRSKDFGKPENMCFRCYKEIKEN